LTEGGELETELIKSQEQGPTIVSIDISMKRRRRELISTMILMKTAAEDCCTTGPHSITDTQW
jgi:hypothetical protein